jgi:hypothetical protein
MEYCLELVVKWEEKRGCCNMVTTEPCEEHKLKEETNVWVVTQGGICTGTDLNKGECSEHNLEGKIRKKHMHLPSLTLHNKKVPM